MTDVRVINGAREGGRRRCALHGVPSTPEGRARGGYVTSHRRYHATRFNENCPCCLEELLQEQLAFFKRYE
jgi:hypothetical protein